MKGDDIRSAIFHRFHIRISFQFRAVLPCAMFLLVLRAYVFLLRSWDIFDGTY